MSVTVRPFKKTSGKWEVDIRLRLPNGQDYREGVKAPVSTKSNALRWAQDRERHLILHGPEQPTKEVPTLEAFSVRFLNDAKAEQQKPSAIAAKETIVRVHLIPHLGDRKLDAITTADVQALKGKLADWKPKTINNVLTVLSTLLKKAVEWHVIETMPCSIKLLKTARRVMSFYVYEEYERLIDAARADSDQAILITLLGGDAGLRCGEIMALEWRDVDLTRRQISVRQSEWKGHVTVPKGGRIRHVPLTTRLAEALKSGRHSRSARVVCESDGAPLSQRRVQGVMRRVARAANVDAGVHILRHTSVRTSR
jgi:integrase